jgi:membrane protein
MADPLSWAIHKIKQINDFIWHTSMADISKGKSFIIRQLRIIVIAARGFMSDRVQLRASALTLYTMLSIIPFVAIAFGIAKGFALDQKLQELLTTEFQTQPEVLTWILNQANIAIQATRGGYIAGIGLIILIWSVMSLLDQIESSFNHIWHVEESRPWLRKFTDYLAIMIIAPVILILSSSLTVVISTVLPDLIARAAILEFFKPLVGFLIKLAPYLLTWIALTVLFIIMPNTKVRFGPALVSGIIAGSILQLLQWLYIDLQFGITKLSAIYGSFAAIPLFIIWVQSSWIILLLGAELTFANQNISRYEVDSEVMTVSHYQRRALVLIIMSLIVRNFVSGEKPLSSETISNRLKMPVRLVIDVLQDLTGAGLVSVIHDNDYQDRLYQPSVDASKLSVSYIMDRFDKKGTDQKIFVKSGEYKKVVSMMDEFDNLIANSDINILVKDL